MIDQDLEERVRNFNDERANDDGDDDEGDGLTQFFGGFGEQLTDHIGDQIDEFTGNEDGLESNLRDFAGEFAKSMTSDERR
jgi:hypothetical protein